LKGEFVTQANEVRNNMDIPTSIMQIAASRISKRHAYSVLLHADPYPFANAVDAGIIDELVDESDFEARVMEKADDLATLGHPHYEKTKNAYIADDVKIIKPLIVK
jgi:enoyl-CoA hydratase